MSGIGALMLATGRWLLSPVLLALLVVSACGRTPLLPPTCNWVAEQQMVDFGEVAPGTTLTQTPLFDNRGAAVCLASNLRLLAGSDPGFSFPASVPLAGSVPVGAQVGMPVSFTPADGWPPLERRGVLAFETNDPSHPHVEVALTAHIQSSCKLVVSPASIDFGHVELGSSASASVDVENQGDGPCAIAGLGLAAPADAQFAVDPSQDSSFTLAPGQRREIGLSFHAVETSPPHHRTATLTFQSTSPQRPTADVPLSADIDIGCELLISPALLDFGRIVLNNAASAQVTLSNDGSAPCPVSGREVRSDGKGGSSALTGWGR